MATLQELRQRRFKTIKDFAEAYGCYTAKASDILNGQYYLAFCKSDVEYLAQVLEVSFNECYDACKETFASLVGLNDRVFLKKRMDNSIHVKAKQYNQYQKEQTNTRDIWKEIWGRMQEW